MSPNAPTDVPTPDLLLDVRTPAELVFSPDETKLAFALHATVADEGSFVPSDLFLIDTGGRHPPVQLTSGPWSDRTPAWAPDGSRLAFLSDRITPGHQLPYTIPATATAGSEPSPHLAATLTGSAESIAWSSDGTHLLVLAADPGCYGLDWSARAVNGATPPPDPTTRHPGDARRRLFLVDLGINLAEEVGPEDRSVWEFDWDGGSTVVALVSEDHSGSGWYQSVVARLDLASRSAETLYEPGWQTGSLALSPDATRAIVVEGYASDHGLLAGSILVVDLATRTTTDPWPDLQTVGLASWCDDTSLWYGRTDGTGTACGRLHLDGRHTEPWRDGAFIGDAVTTPACAVTADATHVWTTHQAHALPPELARFDHDTESWERLTGFNDHIVEGRLFPDSRTIRWLGEDDTEIEGILMTPPGATGRLPTIVCVHGGPTWNWGAYFSDSEPNAVLLASAGYACLLPNPRGSIGRGHAFAQGVIGDGGGVDYRDIMTGVDHCIAEGITDPDRLGIAGLSYGGYMAGWAVGQTDRFGAAVAMSVVSNYVSFHLTSEVWWYDQAILRGEWYDPASQYPERSPVTHAHRCTTPTLIIQGADDRCTPVGQAEELYHAIASSGAEVELVVYPREGHVPVERAHALDAIVRTQTWFDEHLISR
jgi:dipeptidyl aminopeptidase/acylaminoacyl peptidase